jgi:4-hydroxy-2-oxoheptanedioate aldolase
MPARPPFSSHTVLCLAYAMTTPISLRDRLSSGEAAYGAWLTIPDVVSARALASAGLDYVAVDLQHGSATEHDLPAVTTAIRHAGATPVARVRHAHPADIGRALDLGCQAVIVPNVESAAQAATVAGACRYPPAGYRSAGGTLATADPLCFVMVESQHAVSELEATLAVDGIDGIYVGPRDLSLSLGCALDPDDPVLRKELERIWAACARAGKPVGVHASDGATGRLYRENGCQLITLVVDAVAIARAAAAELAAGRG